MAGQRWRWLLHERLMFTVTDQYIVSDGMVHAPCSEDEYIRELFRASRWAMSKVGHKKRMPRRLQDRRRVTDDHREAQVVISGIVMGPSWQKRGANDLLTGGMCDISIKRTQFRYQPPSLDSVDARSRVVCCSGRAILKVESQTQP